MIMMSIDGMHKEKYEKKKTIKYTKENALREGVGRRIVKLMQLALLGFPMRMGQATL
jgi:hypothetical protein